MAYCFTELGILPSDFRQISISDKVIMLASMIDKFERQQEEAPTDENKIKIIG